MQDLNITLIQSELYWHNIDANLAMFEEKLWQIREQPDLIVLPEMFNTGFTMEVKPLAEPMNSKTFRWMKQMAAQSKAVVMGSYIVREGNVYYNRLLWMEPDGNFAHYDKRHLFRMAGEHHSFSPGNSRLIKKIKGWRICPLICYDLRFPVWSRNISINDTDELQYDLLIYIANWPASRIHAWDVLLQARAVENLCYVAGLNRTGRDGKNIHYNGHSAVINPKGEQIFFNSGEDLIRTISLDYDELKHYREKFPAYRDGDAFEIR